jgi:hypothetical protein
MAITANDAFVSGQVLTAQECNNFPRGVVALTSNATQTVTAGYLVGLDTTYTFEAGRNYKISISTNYTITGGSGLILALDVGGTSVQRIFDNRPIAATAGGFHVSGFWCGSVAAGSKTVRLAWAVLSGSAVNSAAATIPNQLIIEDIGTA